MTDFNNAKNAEDAAYLINKLRREDNNERLYQLVGHIIAKHENIDKTLLAGIEVLTRETANYKVDSINDINSKRAASFIRIVKAAMHRAESSRIRIFFCILLKEWFLLCNDTNPGFLKYSEVSFNDLEKILTFENKVRNTVAHSSFEQIDLDELPTGFGKVRAACEDGKYKEGKIYKTSIYDLEDFIYFCAFQNRLDNFLKEYLGMCFEMGLSYTILKDMGVNEINAADEWLNVYFEDEIKALSELAKTSNIYQGHSDREESLGEL